MPFNVFWKEKKGNIYLFFKMIIFLSLIHYVDTTGRRLLGYVINYKKVSNNNSSSRKLKTKCICTIQLEMHMDIVWLLVLITNKIYDLKIHYIFQKCHD